MNNNHLIESIKSFIETYNLLPSKSKVIVGLSGGPDSVFLLNLLNEYKKNGCISLVAAHLNHEWRQDSAMDVIFCRDLCEKLNIEFVHAKASDLPISIRSDGSQEELGRHMRRYYLQKVREKFDADLIAVGHHLQDQEETFFIRLIRGTTLSGLICMKPRDGIYIRPLLETNKVDILSYLNQNNIPHLIDPSNISESYLRNRIRKKVLPALEECDERFNTNFLRTLHNLSETESFLKQVTQRTFESIAQLKDGTWFVDLAQLEKIKPFMQHRLLMHWLIAEQVPFVPSQSFVQEIKRFLFKGSGEHQLHKKWAIQKKQNRAFIKRLS
jgi:tRNA(Ile)-lysidine synthase